MCEQISESCSCEVIVKVVFIIIVIVKIGRFHCFFHCNLKSCLAFLNISSVASLLIILVTVDFFIIVTLVPTVFLQLIFIIIKLYSLIVLKAWITGFQLVLGKVFLHLLFVFL
jgi:hypothetical protein